MRKYVKDNFDYAGKNGEPVADNVQSVGVNGDGVRLAGSHLKPSGKKVIAPFGGSQTGKRLILGQSYDKDSLVDNVNESFAGPHDFMSSWNYENIDGKTYLKSDSSLVNITSGLLLIPSIPFATAPSIKNNLDFIQGYKHTVKENDKRIQQAIDEHKDMTNEN